MVGRKVTSESSLAKKSGDHNINSTTKKSGRVSKSNSKKLKTPKRKFIDKGIQTVHPDIELITADEPPLEYWKQLADERGRALEETLQENEYLHKRIEELEGDNRMLEEMVQDAKDLAEIIEQVVD